MERFGATKTKLVTGKCMNNMVGTRRLELLTSTVSTGRTVILGAICYQIATKNICKWDRG
jgi:hypothetical protein